MSTTELDKSSRILIVGGGTWGCSTALHLARRGYTNVVVLDAHAIPSPISAGNDVNKIVEQGSFSEGDDEAAVAQALLHAAVNGWSNDPIFTPYYHDTGYIVAGSSPESIEHLEKREIRHHDPSTFTRLKTAEDFRNTMPEGVLTGHFPGWEGFYKNSGAGWVHARKALVSAHSEAKRLGVTFITGSPEGQVESLLYQSDRGSEGGNDVKGVRTEDGKEHLADRTILVAGASSPRFLDFENQLRATAWTLGHIAMTDDEVKLFKDLPVLFNIEKGFFMEPDEDKHELKMCDEHPGYCNWVKQPGSELPVSVPIAKQEVPAASEKRMRDFLREIMPQLADRPLCFARVCWCVDTPNRAFLITYHPSSPSLVVATGDSGHGFMHIPSIGGFITDCLEKTLEPRFARSWRWRPETAKGFWGDDTLGRFGAGNKMLDLNETETEGWTHTSEV